LAERRKRRSELWRSIVPPRYRSISHDGCPNPRLVAEVVAWRDARLWESEGQNLVLIGGTGCGKTAEAIAISADIFLQTDLTWELVTVPRWLQEAHASNGRDELDRLSRVGLVVLDDLGAEARDTPFVRERLFALVDGRYVNQRPTIATSNHSLGTLARVIGERTVSRLQHGARVVAVAGDDLRRR
jgi:DNA replication protein DnaC